MMSSEEFWNQVAAYNEAMWPVTVAMTLVAAWLTFRVLLRPGARTDTWTRAYLAFAFAWNGIVFFMIFVRNPISTFTGVPLFILLSVLFAVDIRGQKIRFRLPQTTWKKGLTLVWVALAFLYPLIGLTLGHNYPRMLLPTFPCPLTVFAIALVAAAAPQVDRKLFILLLPWALLALPKCFGALDCYEDAILFASGVYGLVELIRTWKPRRAEPGEEPLAQQRAT